MTEPRPKRQVSYNESAILCPACNKRIRLNNNGRVRVHMSGKVGSDKCMGSNAVPLGSHVSVLESNSAADPKPVDTSLLQKDTPEPVFSDIA
jgi:hypothetical protein